LKEEELPGGPRKSNF